MLQFWPSCSRNNLDLSDIAKISRCLSMTANKHRALSKNKMKEADKRLLYLNRWMQDDDGILGECHHGNHGRRNLITMGTQRAGNSNLVEHYKCQKSSLFGRYVKTGMTNTGMNGNRSRNRGWQSARYKMVYTQKTH